MTKIKICGITNADDARAACELGADALGFILVPGSPRYVGADPARMRRLLDEVPPFVWRVGVLDMIDSAFTDLPELHAVQYYNGSETQGGKIPVGARGPIFIKAFRVRDADSLNEIASFAGPRELNLLDTYSPSALGGTGHTFNWELAQRAKFLGLPIVLAGGLTLENVGEAVRTVRPYMVDVSSGVEAEPGRKDHDKLRRFIAAVREADNAPA